MGVHYGRRRNGNASAVEPYFKYNALLLNGDGTNGAQNNTFVDSSSNAFSITRTGNVAQGTFSPFSLPEGQWSNYFAGGTNGSAAAFYVNGSNVTDFGTSDFTIECWINTSVTGDQEILDSRDADGTNYILVALNTTNKVFVGTYPQTSTKIISSTTIAVNTWYHIAVVRNSGTTKLYINGVLDGSVADTVNYAQGANRPMIGATGYFTYYNGFTGYLSNLRVVKGTAVYTSNFTPSTSPLTAISGTSLLTCQSNRFKDNSSNNFTITRNGDTKVTAFSPFEPGSPYIPSINGGSAYFDGSGDYLQSASSSSVNIGTNDFCIEGWLYKPNNSSSSTPFSFDGSPNLAVIFYSVAGLDKLALMLGGSVIINDVDSFPINQWAHYAITRSSGTIRLFVNGIQKASVSYASSLTTTGSAYVGSDGTSYYYYTGYIASTRFVNGSAVYTANFTPPTSPLTAISNTQLLLNCTNAGIYDNSGKNDIETVGNAQISTSVKKYGTGSMYFDGSGDYLAIPSSTEFAFGTGAFTVEAWVYITSRNSQYLRVFTTSGSSSNFAFEITSAGAMGFYDGSTSFTLGGTVSLNLWNHIAWVRSGTTLTGYINGSSIGTASVSANLTNNTTVCIGATPNYSSGQTAYIDDLRITKGIARYTADFVPPSYPLSIFN